jgi:GAF domain-containing protein
VKPIPQTIEAVEVLGIAEPQADLLGTLQAMADQVRHVVPDCLGMSLAWTDFGVTFTLIATDEEIAVLDALQYLDGGPCVDAVEVDHGIHATHADLFDEDAWRLFARASADLGVRCTLTFPLTDNGTVAGTANLYGASDNAFDGHEEELARIVGGWAPGAVRNADLSFSTRRTAEQAPEKLKADSLVDRAVGYLAARWGLDLATAGERLEDAARRAGISGAQLAAALLRLRP